MARTPGCPMGRSSPTPLRRATRGGPRVRRVYDAVLHVADGKGYYVNDSGTATANDWWTQAELIEMAIDAYDRKPSDRYQTLLTELVYGFVAEQGSDWSYNDFNDDIAWMVIASARAYLNTRNPEFLGYARANWDDAYLAWLQYNANRAWANRRAGDDISWNDWRTATPHMILDSTGASATVQILQVVPPGGEPIAWYNSAPQGGSAGGDIEIHIDAIDGPLIGTCPITATGSWSTYADFSTALTPITGVHDIYLVFRTTGEHAYVGNLNWLKLI